MKKKIVFFGLLALGTGMAFISGCKKDDSDSTAPKITITDGDIYYVQRGKTFTDPGATATDDTDGSVAVTKTGTVDASTVGTYSITYTAKDEAGNKATAVRTVYVVNFDGTYTNVEICDLSGNNTGISALNASNTVANNGISIGNFALSNNTIIGSFTGNKIDAGTSTIGSETYSWSGTITGTTAIVLNIDYITISGVDTNTCSATYTKQ